MVCVDNWDPSMDVAATFVKLAPTIQREDRDSTDWPAVVDEIKQAGAWAVMFAPRVVGVMGERKPVMARRSMDARARIREWLERNPMVALEDHGQVIEYLDAHLAAEGL